MVAFNLHQVRLLVREADFAFFIKAYFLEVVESPVVLVSIL
jgi:hypothetical protein